MRFVVYQFAILIFLLSSVYFSALNYGEATINKASGVTSKSSYGDLNYYVNITKQAVSDHTSLLKDHKIEKVPNTRRLTKGPTSTDPIRRSTITAYGKKEQVHNHQLVPTTLIKERAVVVYNPEKRVRELKSSLNVWHPYVENTIESTFSQIWVTAGIGEQKGTIEAGWHVSPSLYQDRTARFFVHWSNHTAGCYNSLCSGFVVNRNMKNWLGQSLDTSIVDGVQYAINIRMRQDPDTNNWWVKVNGAKLGYWPSTILGDLANGATMIEWGGEVHSAGGERHTATEMGNGRSPTDGYGKACFISNFVVMDYDNTELRLSRRNVQIIQTKQDCYSIDLQFDWTENRGFLVLFGGKGYDGDRCTT